MCRHLAMGLHSGLNLGLIILIRGLFYEAGVAYEGIAHDAVNTACKGEIHICRFGIVFEVDELALVVDYHDKAVGEVDNLDIAADKFLQLVKREVGAVVRGDGSGGAVSVEK